MDLICSDGWNYLQYTRCLTCVPQSKVKVQGAVPQSLYPVILFQLFYYLFSLLTWSYLKNDSNWVLLKNFFSLFSNIKGSVWWHRKYKDTAYVQTTMKLKLPWGRRWFDPAGCRSAAEPVKHQQIQTSKYSQEF